MISTFPTLLSIVLLSAAPEAYRDYLGGFDASQPEAMSKAGKKLLTSYSESNATVQESATVAYLRFVSQMARAVNGRLGSLNPHTKSGRTRLAELGKSLMPHGLFIEWCEGASFTVVERPGFIVQKLKGFGDSRIQAFLKLRNLELSRPMGTGCEGLEKFSIGAAEYAQRRAAIEEFTTKYQKGELVAAANSFLRRYGANFKSYTECKDKFQSWCAQDTWLSL